MEDSQEGNLIKTVATIVDKNSNESEFKYIKVTDVNKDEQTSLDEDTVFKFSCHYINDEKLLCIELSEIGALCPFIYQRKLNLEDMKKIHKAFRACDNMEDVEKHINRLFKTDGKIWLTKNDNEDIESINLNLKILFMADEDDRVIELYKVMTSEKDKALEELYKNEKDYIKNPKESGYRGYHIIVSIPISIGGIIKNINCEIQIRTTAMDFWATNEHKLNYKSRNHIKKYESKWKEAAVKVWNLDTAMNELYLEEKKNNKKKDNLELSVLKLQSLDKLGKLKKLGENYG